MPRTVGRSSDLQAHCAFLPAAASQTFKKAQCSWPLSFLLTAAGQLRICTGFPLTMSGPKRGPDKPSVKSGYHATRLNLIYMRRAVFLAVLCSIGLSAQKQPFDVQALYRLVRIGEPHLSPDGKMVAFTARRVDLDANTQPRQIYVVASDGSTAPRQLTLNGTINERPRWSPDGKRIAFISNRSGSSQVWTMDPDGGTPKQLTLLSTEASGLIYTPDGKGIVFTSDVYPECGDDTCNKNRIEAAAKSKVKARVYTELLYRHWNEFQSQRRKHLMVIPTDGAGVAKDLTPGVRDVPPFSLGGPDDYAVSPDSTELVYAMNADKDQALSTNWDLWTVPLTGGEAKRITTNLAADASPAYSPDGQYIAWRAQAKPGYESDRWRLVLYDRKADKATTLTESLDRSVQAFTFSPDSTRLFYVIEERGRTTLQMIPVGGGGTRVIISASSHVDDVQFSPDGKSMIYTENSGSKPAEIYRVSNSGGAATALTKMNDAALAAHPLTPLEELTVEGAEKAKVQSFVVKPPGFDAAKKHPVLFLIHGGPQGAWGESWSYRWNAQVFAAAGFVVVMPNPRGSTGYGQKFTDDINSDWGGKVYEDIMNTVDHVAAQPWADPSRFAAAGGSYGGYMVNWMLGHTDRFKAFVSHAGVFDLRSMAGETEETWFPRWDFQGMPWEQPELYARWSPSYFVKDFKTPTLVIHGELDYRVPVGQGMQLFTALQMQRVPSKLLLFPDEGHWIGKPQNGVLWYNSFLDWVTEWTKKVEGN